MAQHSDFLNTPIFVRPGMRAPYPTNLKTSKPEDFSPLQAMEHAALFDNKEEYIKGFKNWPSDKDIRHETWSYMFQYDSVKCAIAVLDGETDGRLNLVAAVSDYGSSLLHEAAKFEAYNITAMLLDRGESADTEVNKLLPLELVMRTLMPYYIFTRESERMRGRDPEMSVFQTIVMLSAERRPNLETLRLLARRTQKIEGLFIKYLKEGKVVELVSLLMVGCRPSTTSLLKTQDEFLKKQVIVELLETFARIGDELSAFTRFQRSFYISVDRLIAEIATLFEEGGLPVKCEDTPSQELFRRHFFPDEEGEQYFSWSQQAQGILSSKYQGSFTYGQQVPGPLTWNNQGAPSHGLRSFHSSSFPKPDRGIASSFLKADRGIASSSQLKSSYNAAPKFVCSKQFSVYLMALRRGLRHL